MHVSGSSLARGSVVEVDIAVCYHDVENWLKCHDCMIGHVVSNLAPRHVARLLG